MKKLELVTLKAGATTKNDKEMCVMEAVAWVAGEPWSDHPTCVSPVISAFCRSWNDALDDKTRQRLKPYIPQLIGTKDGPATENRLAWMVTDWLVREHAPAFMDLTPSLQKHAKAMREVPELVDAKSAAAGAAARDAAWDAAGAAAGAAAWDAAGAAAWDAAGAAARAAAWDAAGAAAWDAAGAAARAAARDAARDAAWDAARDAAWDAAGAAARDAARAAARDAARDAAWDAARAAARDAARDAAGATLKPTVIQLQESAFHLLDRMIAVAKDATK